MKQKDIAELSQGNPGALHALISIATLAPDTFETIKEYGIKGSDIYVLWSDLCNKNVYQVAQVVKNCPRNILVDACSRQDFSGRDLIAPYNKIV